MREDIRAVKQAVGDKILKVIIETCLLTDVVEGCACGGEAGAGLDVVRACLADDIAHLFLFLVGQQAKGY